jgi:hypothetical protein
MATLFVLAPSFLSLGFNGFLILIFMFIILFNFKSFLKMDYQKQLQLIGTLAIAFGVHGTLHLGLENAYNFNPYLLLFN